MSSSAAGPSAAAPLSPEAFGVGQVESLLLTTATPLSQVHVVELVLPLVEYDGHEKHLGEPFSGANVSATHLSHCRMSSTETKYSRNSC